MFIIGISIVGGVYYAGCLFKGISIIGVFTIGLICYKRCLSVDVNFYWCILKGVFIKEMTISGVSIIGPL